MKLYAISDLHLGHAVNREALLQLCAHPDDWLILAGDTGETPRHLEFALKIVVPRFARVIWTPGNHDLWVTEGGSPARYQEMVELCRSYGVVTPEDAAPRFGDLLICPIFTLYDYSFHPSEVEDPLAWARESGVVCADESYLHPQPFGSRAEWCAERCRLTEERLAGCSGDKVLIGHFPLREELAVLPRVPRFTIWCGTRRTHDWHLRFGARVVVFGHLHIRSTRWIDGVRFEEVSLGNPNQWRPELGVGPYLREILPGPEEVLASPRFRRLEP